jgi:hypothetical protein
MHENKNPGTAGTVPRAKGSGHKSYLTPAASPAQASQFYVTDGRESVGVVVASGKRWKAISPDGKIVGIFKSLCLASRALPIRKIL